MNRETAGQSKYNHNQLTDPYTLKSIPGTWYQVKAAAITSVKLVCCCYTICGFRASWVSAQSHVSQSLSVFASCQLLQRARRCHLLCHIRRVEIDIQITTVSNSRTLIRPEGASVNSDVVCRSRGRERACREYRLEFTD